MSERILVVDDDENITLVLKLTLERAGYDITSAQSGVEALSQVAKDSFSLLLPLLRR